MNKFHMSGIFNEIDSRFQMELLPWLPMKIFDFHTHIGLPSHLICPPEGQAKIVAASLATSQSVEQLEEGFRFLFHKKSISYVSFPFVFRGIDIDNTNSYVYQTEFPIVLANLSNPKSTIELIRTPKVKGLKVYHWFVNKKRYEDITISDMILPEMMDSLNQEKKVLMLHVPGNSISDKLNICQVEYLSRNFPHSSIVLTHMGRCHITEDLRVVLNRINNLENVILEASTVSSPEVFKLALDCLGPRRIVYGSDSPYSNIRGRVMEIPGPMKRAFITPNNYAWTLPDLREWYLKNNPELTFMVYHQIAAMKKAFEDLELSEQDKKDVFFCNAKRLLNRSLTS